MSEQSKIQWCDSTGGPWLVCSEVSPGCLNCYARELAETRLAPLIRKSYRAAGFADWKTRPVWGNSAPRVLSKGFWSDVGAFNRRPWICDACGGSDIRNLICNACGEMNLHRRRCFPSLIDWLDDMPAGIIDQNGKQLVPAEVLGSFLEVVRVADQVTWILCTKRPQDFFSRLENVLGVTDEKSPLFKFVESWLQGFPPRNVILLTTVENQDQEPRMDDLRKIPAACRGVSFEPLLSEVSVRDWSGISWAIVGGESGREARGCDVNWIRSLVHQTAAHGVDVFVKQYGAKPYQSPEHDGATGFNITLKDKKGGDKSEWAADLQFQNWPKGF